MPNNKPEQIKELLERSTLDDRVKGIILDNLGQLSPDDLLNLEKVLKVENNRLEKATEDIETFLSVQESGWAKVEEEQKNLAKNFTEETAVKMDKEAENLKDQ